MKAVKNVLTAALLGATLLGTSAFAGAPVPPATIARDTYPQWLKAIGAPDTAFFDYTFRWYEAQANKPLPPQVNADPDKLFVSVDGPLAETIKREKEGDVEESVTFGLETYGIINAPVTTVLETILFRWGKPVGKPAGVTHPNDTVFANREERASPDWGPGSYHTITKKSAGGVAADQNDEFSLLVRGDAAHGFVLAGSFIKPAGSTTTSSYITLMIIRPMADGRTDYRVAGFLTGQSYAFFGPSGRLNFGFNAARIRDGQKDFYGQVKALKETGKIPERKQ